MSLELLRVRFLVAETASFGWKDGRVTPHLGKFWRVTEPESGVNDEMTLSIADPSLSIKLIVYDKDKFKLDDKMGDADIHIGPFLDASRMRLDDVHSGTVITRVKLGRDNCLAEESCIVWSDGKVVQDMVLRLRNVERGEVELQLQWIDIPCSRGL